MPPRQRTRKPPDKPLVEQVLEEQPQADNPLLDPPVRLFLPTGCAVLNCVLSDRVDGGWPCGRIVNPIGDSDTCKTVMAMGALAEAAGLRAFDKHRLIYLDEEASVTCQPLFGSRLKRIGLLTPDAEDPQYRAPETIEELHYFLLDRLDEGPFICVVDSFDALPSRQELEETKTTKKIVEAARKKADEQEEETESGQQPKKPKGSYNMSKQKYNKKMLREIKGKITESDSLLIIVSQTIANINSMFDPKTVAGGVALEFFSRIRFWLSKTEKTDTVGPKGRKTEIGRNLLCKVTKNHITGKKRKCNLWVYEKYGIMDVMTSLDWLVAEGALPKLSGWVEVPQWGVKKQMKDLIKHVLDNHLEESLAKLVQEQWDKKEASLDMGWGRRYE